MYQIEQKDDKEWRKVGNMYSWFYKSYVILCVTDKMKRKNKVQVFL